MDLCGNIYVSKDLSEFSLKCFKCEKNLSEWKVFVKHIQNCLLPNEEDEPYIDVPCESKLDEKMGIFEVIEPHVIKLEDDSENSESNEEKGKDATNEKPFSPIGLKSTYDDDKEFLNTPVKYENSDNDSKADETMADVQLSEEESGAEDDNFLDDEFSTENSSSDESFSIKKKRNIRTKSRNFSPSFHRQTKCTYFFIELYKAHPCLWDENHVNFKDEATRNLAYDSMIKSIKKDCQAVLNEKKLKSLISRIRKQYYATQESLKEDPKTKIKPLVMEYYQLCSFLGEIDESKNELVADTGFKIRCQVFNNFRKDVIDAIIDLYAANSVLYDYNDPEHASNLKRNAALNSIMETLKKDHDLQLTGERFSNLMRSLRDWYHKTSELQKKGNTLSKEELYYLERCKFFPPKVKKLKLKCNLCQAVAMSDKTLQLHMVEVHNIGEMPHKCEECNRFFRQRSSLLLHNQRSHTAKKLECEYCHRKFSVLADHRLHVRTHTLEKPYICELCGKAFRIRSQLNYHTTAIHTKVRAFKCNLCPKDFLKAVHLRDHIKSHLNIRDKICETCGKGFTNCHSLIRHRQIHSAVKKFECKLCDAKFHQFVGLNSHMKRTHNIVKNKPKA